MEKKDVKSRYTTLIADKERLSKTLKNRQEEIYEEIEQRRSELKWKHQQEEERQAAELHTRQEEHERTRGKWEEKLEAELDMTHRRLELEKSARSTAVKLSKLKITSFKGTPTDWVRFSNMFITQVHNKPISAEEKFGYLLEMVSAKVRENI